MSWLPVIDAHEHSERPRYMQIAEAIAADIARGRLLPAQRLPGARSLAAALEVHRNTVDAAFRSLASRGWIESRPRSGFFVVGDPGEPPPVPAGRGLSRRDAVPRRLGYKLGPAPVGAAAQAPSRGYLLHGGLPDLRLFPHEALARAYRRALRKFAPYYAREYPLWPLVSALLLLSPANRTALRAYEKSGFRRHRLVDVLEQAI